LSVSGIISFLPWCVCALIDLFRAVTLQLCGSRLHALIRHVVCNRHRTVTLEEFNAYRCHDHSYMWVISFVQPLDQWPREFFKSLCVVFHNAHLSFGYAHSARVWLGNVLRPNSSIHSCSAVSEGSRS